MKRVVLLVVVSLAMAACTTTDGGTDTAGPTGSPTDDRSDVMESREDRLPEGFPQDFPLPADHRVVYSQWSEQGSVVYFDATQTESALIGFFEEELADEGWVIRECTRTDASPSPATLIIAQKAEVLTTTVIGQLPNPNVDLDATGYRFFVTVLRTSTEVAQASPVPCPEE